MNRWEIVGKLCGYPECCIKEFCERMNGQGPPLARMRQLTGTGYVPCAKCDEKDVFELLHNIAINRDKRLKFFPNQEGLREIYTAMPEWIEA